MGNFIEINNSKILTVLKNDKYYFAVKDICDQLYLKNASQAINGISSKYIIKSKVRCVINKPKARYTQELLFIDEEGLLLLITKSYKLTNNEKFFILNRLKQNGYVQNYVFKTIKETDFFSKLQRILLQLDIDILRQYFVKYNDRYYYVDYFIPNYNIIIEYDEYYHKYNEMKDKIRLSNIKDAMLNNKIIRIKENEDVYISIGKVINLIFKNNE